MTREEAKELLPLVQAFIEGKKIEVLNNSGKWAELEYPLFCKGPKYYRIKQEPKYRPFNNQEECWQEMQKHQPFGWVTDGYYKSTITVKSDSIVVTISSLEYDFGKAYAHFTFADSTPFGIKEE